MMRVEELFQVLSYGELGTHRMTSDASGGIVPEQHDRLIVLINQGLTSLYSRFLHRRKHLTLETVTGYHEYNLIPKHAKSNTDPNNTAPRFILDSDEDPFTGDLIKVLKITPVNTNQDEQDVNKAPVIGLNHMNSNHAFQVTGNKILWAMSPKTGDRYLIEYQASHPKLKQPADMDAEIHLAPYLYDALCAYVAGRVYSSMGGQEHKALGNDLMARFEMLCEEAKYDDMVEETVSNQFDKLRANGFI